MSSSGDAATRKPIKTKKPVTSAGYTEDVVQCPDADVCKYMTKINIKIGNDQRVILLLRHYDEEYYLILHQSDFIVAYPIVYRRVAPYTSLYYYRPFHESGSESYAVQNERGKAKCLSDTEHQTYASKRPDFEGFRGDTLSVCCSCADRPHVYETINDYFAALPRAFHLHCYSEASRKRRSYDASRVVAVKRLVRHLFPFYAIFRFKNEKKAFVNFHITVFKKKKTFSEYLKILKDKTPLESTESHFRYLIDETTDLKLFDEKYLNISYSSDALAGIKVPPLYDNFLLIPIYPKEYRNVTYDPLEYGCSYSKKVPKFFCIEGDSDECEYVDSACLRHSIYVSNDYVADTGKPCGKIGYNEDSIMAIDNCTSKTKCVRTTVESYLTISDVLTKGKPESTTKLPLIGGNYPYYIFKKKAGYVRKENKRSEDFLKDSTMDHYIAYEYKQTKRTEYTISIYNKVDPSQLQASAEEAEASAEAQMDSGYVADGDKNKPSAERYKYNIYDGVVFYVDAINEPKIINILYSDSCNESTPQNCGVIVHVWKPVVEEKSFFLSLECKLYGEEEIYSDLKTASIGKNKYQKLFFFKMNTDTFYSLNDCNVNICGAFSSFDVQLYSTSGSEVFNKLYNTSPDTAYIGHKLYADGIKKFACCQDDDKVCLLKQIPKCDYSSSVFSTKVMIATAAVFALFVACVVIFLIKKKRNNYPTYSGSEVDEEKDIEAGKKEEDEEEEEEKGEEKVEEGEGEDAEEAEEEAEEEEEEEEAEEEKEEAEEEADKESGQESEKENE